MATARYIYWKDNDMYLGYFVDFPDYWTQGETLADLKEHLLDLFQDMPLYK